MFTQVCLHDSRTNTKITWVSAASYLLLTSKPNNGFSWTSKGKAEDLMPSGITKAEQNAKLLFSFSAGDEICEFSDWS